MNKKSTYKAKTKVKVKPKAKVAAPKPKAMSNAAKKALGRRTVAENKKQGANKPLAKQQSIKKVPIKVSKKVEEKFPHFRYYLKSKHPALIVGEQAVEEYKYRKVMHGEKDGKRPNEKIYPNPNIQDEKPMYIGKRVRHDKKSNFEPKPLPWEYPKKDKKK